MTPPIENALELLAVGWRGARRPGAGRSRTRRLGTYCTTVSGSMCCDTRIAGIFVERTGAFCDATVCTSSSSFTATCEDNDAWGCDA